MQPNPTHTHTHTQANWKVWKWGSSSNYLVKKNHSEKPFWKEPSLKRNKYISISFPLNIDLACNFSLIIFYCTPILFTFFSKFHYTQSTGWMMADSRHHTHNMKNAGTSLLSSKWPCSNENAEMLLLSSKRLCSKWGGKIWFE